MRLCPRFPHFPRHDFPDLFCSLWSFPFGALQRYRTIPSKRRYGKISIFRRHTHPHHPIDRVVDGILGFKGVASRFSATRLRRNRTIGISPGSSCIYGERVRYGVEVDTYPKDLSWVWFHGDRAGSFLSFCGIQCL